jgi:hypothetical protein
MLGRTERCTRLLGACGRQILQVTRTRRRKGAGAWCDYARGRERTESSTFLSFFINFAGIYRYGQVGGTQLS